MTASAMRAWPIARPQMGALMRKNWLLKRRAPVTTLFEVFLPALFMCLLLLGFSLSEVDVFDEGVYNGRYVNATALLEVVGGPSALADLTAGETLDISANVDGGEIDGLLSLRSSLDAILNGPLPVPSLAQFVGIHMLTRGLTESVQNELLSQNRFGRLFGNVLTLGGVHLSPASPATKALADYLEAQAAEPSFRVQRHASESEAVSWILNNTHEQTWALVHFDALEPCAIRYNLRVNYTTIPNTWSRVRFVARGLDTEYQKYWLSGVLTLQRALHGFLLHLADPTVSDDLMAGTAPALPADVDEPLAGAPLVPFPTARYSQNIFYRAVGYLMGFFMANALMYPVSQLVRAIVEEKETRLRQTMLSMGLRYDVLVAAWMATAAVQFTATAFIVTAVMCSSFIANSNPVLVFLYIEAFLLSTISLAFLLSTMFSRAKLAAVAAPMIYIALVIPKFAFFATDRGERVSAKLATSLLSPSAFAFGADFLADYEYAEVGVTFANASSEDFSFGACIWMMLLDAVVYMVAAVYLDQTLPTQYGAPLHPLFCLPAPVRAVLPWGLGRAGSREEVDGVLDPLAAAEIAAGAEPIVETDEAAMGRMGASYDGVYVDHLVKVYGAGASLKVAVKQVTFGMLRGRITCLLGHNGAGKTSLISVLTGLYPPTAGDCFVFGCSVARAREEVWRRLGVCPQHDVLFPRLTVQEHMALFAAIKGAATPLQGELSGDDVKGAALGAAVPPFRCDGIASSGAAADADAGADTDAEHASISSSVAAVRAEVVGLLAAVGLEDKAETQAYALSGGMKRKLSVALALLGRSRAVLLDEPTSGMDPHSRRATWELLRESKSSRALVLTTHYMDEADLLADRTAVMADGHLQALGSSLFLKARFGLGYSLTVQFAFALSAVTGAGDGEEADAADVAPPGVSTGAEADAAARAREDVRSLLASHVPEVQLVHVAANEASFRLPLSASAAFPALLRDLDTLGPSLSLGGYGMSVTSMEEVFMELAKQTPTQLRASEVALVGALASDEARSTAAEVRPPPASAGDGRVPNAWPAVLPGKRAGVAGPVLPQAEPSHESDAEYALPYAPSVEEGREGAAPAVVARAGADAQAEAVAAATRLEGRAPVLTQVGALLWKRLLCARRDRKGTAANVLAPVVLVALVQLVLTIDTRTTGPRIPLASRLWWEEETALQYAAGVGRARTDDAATPPPEPTNFIEAALVGLADVTSRGPDSEEEDQVTVGVASASALRATVRDHDPFIDPVDVNVTSSIALSRHLLDTWDSDKARERPRFMGLVADDRVELKLEVTPELELLGAQALLAIAVVCPLATASADVAMWRAAFAAGAADSFAPRANLSSFEWDATAVAESWLNATAAAVLAVDPWRSPAANAWRAALAGVEALVTAAAVSDSRSVGDGLGSGSLGDFLTGILAGRARDRPALLARLLGNSAAAVGGSGVSLFANVTGLLEDLAEDNTVVRDVCGVLGGALTAVAGNDGITVDGRGVREMVGGALLMVLVQPVSDLAADVLDGRNGANLTEAASRFGNRTGVDAGVAEALARAALSVLAFATPGREAPLGTLRLGELRIPVAGIVLRDVTLGAESAKSRDAAGAQGIVPVEAVVTEALLEASVVADGSRAIAAALLAWADPAAAFQLAAGRAVRIRLAVDEIVAHADGVALYGVCTEVGLRGESCVSEYSFGRAPPTADGEQAQRAKNVTVSLAANLTAMHNSTSPHAIGVVTGALQSAQYLRRLKDGGHDCPAVGGPRNTSGNATTSERYEASLEPLPLTSKQELELRLVLAVLASLFVLVPFCYVPAAFAVFIVRERAVGAKHLQLLSGARASVYWLSVYVWDLFLYAVLVGLVLLVLLAYGEPSLVGAADTVGALALHMGAYGAAVLPQTYILSLRFESHSTAQIALVLWHLVNGFVLVMANLIMRSLDRTRATAAVLVHTYRLLPPFNFGEGLLALSQSYYEELLVGRPRHLFATEILGRPIAYNAWLAIAHLGALLLLERREELWRAARRALRIRDRDVAAAEAAASAAEASHASAKEATAPRQKGSTTLRSAAAVGAVETAREDEDVAEERRLALTAAADNEAVLLRGLWKVYARRGGNPPKLAVQDLSVRVHPCECFGLLGVNGAGKSTTLKVLTGFHRPTRGAAFVGGFDVAAQLQSVYSTIGYCPQTDPLLDHMTARETLLMYGALKHMPRDRALSATEALIDLLGLRPHANRPTAAYSGGNKRKTALAIALLGSPSVIFLDEPSSGMDPLARRRMWDVLSAEARRRAIVLTSHSMEECEALCHRVGIISGGRLRALGGLQRLKLRFGGGYVLELKCADGRVADVQAFVRRTFGTVAHLDEWHGVKLKYLMKRAEPHSSGGRANDDTEAAHGRWRLADIFEAVQAAMTNVGIVEYAASQPTLEQVFLDLARAYGDDPRGGRGDQAPDVDEEGDGDGLTSTVEPPHIVTVAETTSRAISHGGGDAGEADVAVAIDAERAPPSVAAADRDRVPS